MAHKRGHSNVRVKELVRCSEPYLFADSASISLWGGASPSTSKELPPLVLRIEEWQEIGQKMGWFKQVCIEALVGD